MTQKKMGPLGMKTLCGEGDPVKKGAISVEEALGYALSQPVAAIVSGIDSPDVLRQNLNIAGGFKPWDRKRLDAVRDKVRAVAADGRFELFKTSMKYDGKPGREQHGFPSKEELGG